MALNMEKNLKAVSYEYLNMPIALKTHQQVVFNKAGSPPNEVHNVIDKVNEQRSSLPGPNAQRIEDFETPAPSNCC